MSVVDKHAKTFAEVETFEVCHCGKCGIAFALTAAFLENRRTHGTEFYCPNGHCRVFRTSDIEKAKEEIQRLKNNLKWEQDYATRQRELAEKTQRSLSATKGLVTKMKNRAANGVCPCCNRYFENLHRHMNTQHPDYRTEETP